MRALRLAGLVLLHVLAGCGGPPAAPNAPTAPSATSAPARAGHEPGAARTDLQRSVLVAKADAVNKEDPRAVAEAYTTDARTFSIGGAGFEETGGGREGVAKDQAHMIQTFALRFELDRVLLADGVGVVEWKAAGTHRETGKPVHLRGAQLLRFAGDGHIASEHSYSDTASVAVQLGMLPGRVREPTGFRGSTSWSAPAPSARDAELVARVRGLWASWDPAALEGALADDVVLDEVPLPAEVSGKRDALPLLARYRAAMPDLAVKVEQAAAFGDVVARATVMTGTQTGSFEGIAASGRRLALHFLDVVETRGERITRVRRYANRVEWLGQMGVLSER